MEERKIREHFEVLMRPGSYYQKNYTLSIISEVKDTLLKKKK
jgi:hypothetical protein